MAANMSEEELQALYTWVRPELWPFGMQQHQSFLPPKSGMLAAALIMNRRCLQVDDIPLSRPKRNIGRDFADGGALMAHGH